jgi:hypothetical protein
MILLGITFSVMLFITLASINKTSQDANKYLLVLSKQFNLEDENGNPILYQG